MYLLQDEVFFSWDLKQDTDFHALCEALSSKPVLIHPDFDLSFILFTNASNVTIKAILSQQDSNLVNHLVAYYNKILSRADRNYSVTEREWLAVLLTIKRFRPSST